MSNLVTLVNQTINETKRRVIYVLNVNDNSRKLFFKMDKVINLGIPHVGELIFESLEDEELFECLEVSQTWKILAENVLFKRWRGKIFEACANGITEVVKILLERLDNENNEWNARAEDEESQSELG